MPDPHTGNRQRHIILFSVLSLFFITIAVNIEVPLYTTYARNAGFGSGITALAFALYILGVLPVMFFLGGISDRIGRKITIIGGLVLMILATTLMIVQPTIYSLCIARILQGIGFGLSVPACTAYLAEMVKDGASYAAKGVAIMTSLGFGSGSLLTSFALLSGSSLTPWSYWFVACFLIFCIVLSIGLPEKKGEQGSLLRLPYYPPGSIKAGLAIALAWAVSGSILTIIPSQLAKVDLVAWVGLTLFFLNFFGVISQPFARKIDSKKAILFGYVLIPVGYTLLVVGSGYGILLLVLAGSALAGMACYGFTYLGSLAEVTKAAGNQRARATSGYFFFAYMGFVLPSIVVGFIADQTTTMTALWGFTIVVIVISFLLWIVSHRSNTIG